MPLASVFTGPGVVAILAVAVVSLLIAERAWRWAVVLVVVADALTWSWLGWLKWFGNVLYWGAAVGVAASLLLLARTSVTARRLLIGVIVATAALTATVAWSFERHATIRAAVTLGSALCVAAFAAAHAVEEPGARDRLVRALGVVAPVTVVVGALVIVFEHARAVAAGGGVSGFLNGPNSLGILLALTIGFVLAAPAVERRALLAFAWMFIAAFVATLSASRTGMLAGVVAVVVYELGMRRWRRLVVVAGAVVAAGVLTVVWVPNVPTLGRPIALPSSGQHTPAQARQIFGGQAAGQSLFSALVGARDEAWQQAAGLLDRRPLLGSGFGTGNGIFEHDGVRSKFRDFIGAWDPNANVHDAYLQELLELGIPGGLLFLAPLLASAVLVVLGLRRGWRSPGEGAFAAAAAAAVVASVFESVVSGFGAMTLLTWLSVAMLIVPALPGRLATVERRGENPSRTRSDPVRA